MHERESRNFPNETKWFSADILASSDAQNDARMHVDYTWREDECREELKGPSRAQVYYSVMVKRLVRSPSGPYATLTVARATCTWLIITRRPSLSARDCYRYLPPICSHTLTHHCRKLIHSIELIRRRKKDTDTIWYAWEFIRVTYISAIKSQTVKSSVQLLAESTVSVKWNGIKISYLLAS